MPLLVCLPGQQASCRIPKLLVQPGNGALFSDDKYPDYGGGDGMNMTTVDTTTTTAGTEAAEMTFMMKKH